MHSLPVHMEHDNAAALGVPQDGARDFPGGKTRIRIAGSDIILDGHKPRFPGELRHPLVHFAEGRAKIPRCSARNLPDDRLRPLHFPHDPVIGLFHQVGVMVAVGRELELRLVREELRMCRVLLHPSSAQEERGRDFFAEQYPDDLFVIFIRQARGAGVEGEGDFPGIPRAVFDDEALRCAGEGQGGRKEGKEREESAAAE